ncbi:MAG: hypothetical protein JWM46_514 [Candidatus Kaiserbacteria bacterium]|nr:hypothetical protein [Candidatus Kaiserbacteria bacterium]
MRALIASALLTFLFPLSAFAFPFGGQAALVIPCYNGAIYAFIGPPIGGPYIWTPSTQTYRNGPPTHSGQWLLGLAGAPYYCIVSIEPINVFPGTAIMMLGTSQQ